MHHPLVLVVEHDGRLAGLLRGACDERQWLLREPRRLASCLELLLKNPRAAVVVRIGRDLVGELSLVDQVARLFPAAPLVVVCDAEEWWLNDIAWDLGACYVLPGLRAGPLLVPLVQAIVASPPSETQAPRTNQSEANDRHTP